MVLKIPLQTRAKSAELAKDEDRDRNIRTAYAGE